MKEKKEALFVFVVSAIATPVLLVFATIHNNLLIYSGALIASFLVFKSLKSLTQHDHG